MSKVLLVPSGITSTMATENRAGLNALIFAVGKAGKTALATSIVNHPSVIKCLHIDIDSSPDSLMEHPKLDRAAVPSGAKGWERIEELSNYLHAGQHNYNAVILDTITTMGTYGLDDVLVKNFLNTRRPETSRLAFPSMGDYGINNRRCLRLIRFFRDFAISRGWHVIFLAHEKTDKADSGAISYRPALSGQLMDVVPGVPSMVARLVQHKPGQRYLQLAFGDGVAAGYRHSPTKTSTVPPKIQIKNYADPKSHGMDLADIWTAICKERQGI